MDGWNTPARIFHVLHLMYLNPPLEADRQASRNNYVNREQVPGKLVSQ